MALLTFVIVNNITQCKIPQWNLWANNQSCDSKEVSVIWYYSKLNFSLILFSAYFLYSCICFLFFSVQFSRTYLYVGKIHQVVSLVAMYLLLLQFEEIKSLVRAHYQIHSSLMMRHDSSLSNGPQEPLCQDSLILGHSSLEGIKVTLKIILISIFMNVISCFIVISIH